LPSTITLQQLKQVHSSHPRNPILAGACFLGGYIDAWGSGIMKILNSCQAAGLPMPDFDEKEGGFIVTLYKDNLIEEQLVKLGLNKRQIQAVLYVKEKGRITNREYQEINEISNRTSSRELENLKQVGVFKKRGDKKGTYYER
jgi:ATP-dependent DNA helicase RecG